MEAKLASMAKRKPADEDYVPGQGTYSGSGTSSPMPEGDDDEDVEMHGEGTLGQDVGEKAAVDLETEIQEELLRDAKQEVNGESIHPEKEAFAVSPDIEGRDAVVKAPIPPTRLAVMTSDNKLPARPPVPATTATTPSMDVQAKAREEAIKRGLAGLPKKPVSS